jgi:hypothetical protein
VITDRHSSIHRALSSLDETFVGSVATLVAPADEIVLNRPDENVTEAERGDVVQIRRVLHRQTLNCSYEAELRVDLRCICDTHHLMVSSRSLLSREKASRLPVYACDVLSKAHLHPFSSTH